MRFMNLDRNLLRHLPVVRAVAHRQSFSGAARELGMTASAVSHAVRAVERAVGLPLFARTTRSVALTEAGQALVAELDAALVGIERQVESLRNAETGVRGTLRLNTPGWRWLGSSCPSSRRFAKDTPDWGSRCSPTTP